MAGSMKELAPSAQPGPALDDRDLQVTLDESGRRREARQAAADNHDVGRGWFGNGVRHSGGGFSRSSVACPRLFY